MDDTLIGRARRMRRNPTEAEHRLWQALRGKARGVKFRRQVPLGGYIVDFACLSHRVVVEVDGDQHAANGYDARRDHWLAANHFMVLRVSNREVLGDLAGVLAAIDQAVAIAADASPVLSVPRQ